MLTETNENELDDMLLLNDEDMARILSNESSSSNGCEMESRGMVQHDFELQDDYTAVHLPDDSYNEEEDPMRNRDPFNKTERLKFQQQQQQQQSHNTSDFKFDDLYSNQKHVTVAPALGSRNSRKLTNSDVPDKGKNHFSTASQASKGGKIQSIRKASGGQFL